MERSGAEAVLSKGAFSFLQPSCPPVTLCARGAEREDGQQLRRSTSAQAGGAAGDVCRRGRVAGV